MRFIHKENIVALQPFRKKTLQIHIRVKYIIIVTDDIIDPACRIQTKFKRADHKFLRLL